MQSHAVAQERALLYVLGGSRVDDEDEVRDRQGFAEVARGEINGLEVIEHPRKDLAAADGMQELWPHLHFAGVDLIQAVLAILAADDVPAIEAVDQNLALEAIVLEQEVPRQPDASQSEADALRHFHVDDRKRD